jgi:hypothetical protein
MATRTCPTCQLLDTAIPYQYTQPLFYALAVPKKLGINKKQIKINISTINKGLA